MLGEWCPKAWRVFGRGVRCARAVEMLRVFYAAHFYIHDIYFDRTFECISEFLCFESMLASPALAFASERPVTPHATPLMSAALKQDFLPIASKRMMLLSSPDH